MSFKPNGFGTAPSQGICRCSHGLGDWPGLYGWYSPAFKTRCQVQVRIRTWDTQAGSCNNCLSTEVQVVEVWIRTFSSDHHFWHGGARRAVQEKVADDVKVKDQFAADFLSGLILKLGAMVQCMNLWHSFGALGARSSSFGVWDLQVQPGMDQDEAGPYLFTPWNLSVQRPSGVIDILNHVVTSVMISSNAGDVGFYSTSLVLRFHYFPFYSSGLFLKARLKHQLSNNSQKVDFPGSFLKHVFRPRRRSPRSCRSCGRRWRTWPKSWSPWEAGCHRRLPRRRFFGSAKDGCERCDERFLFDIFVWWFGWHIQMFQKIGENKLHGTKNFWLPGSKPAEMMTLDEADPRLQRDANCQMIDDHTIMNHHDFLRNSSQDFIRQRKSTVTKLCLLYIFWMFC